MSARDHRRDRCSGHAATENADVRGRFEGQLVVRKRLLIRAGGHVSGTITYGEIEIESGGKITGVIEEAAPGQLFSGIYQKAHETRLDEPAGARNGNGW